MDIALTLHADHELNASTFAARVVAAATLTDVHSAIVAGIGTLKGPLHGGANAEVMKMLLEIGADAPAERIDAYVRGKLARKEKISGFGHRVYTRKIRARRTCGRMSKELGEQAPATPSGSRCPSGSRRIVRGEKKLYPNVDFYSASTYYTMGIAIDLYTPIFAVSRDIGMDRARARAVRQQPPDSAARGLHRSGLSADLDAAGPALNVGTLYPPANTVASNTTQGTGPVPVCLMRT